MGAPFPYETGGMLYDEFALRLTFFKVDNRIEIEERTEGNEHARMAGTGAPSGVARVGI
jgi:hypothetical protein